MGDLIFGSYRDQNQELKRKAKEIIKEKMDEIIEFFNFHGDFEKPNGPKNDNTLNMDKAIEKIYYPGENRYKLHLRIFFNKFNNLNDKNEYQRKFDEFFNALIKADNSKIYELIGINIEDTDLVKKKQGLESLMEIFGTENLKSYYKNVFIGGGIGTACLAALGSFFAWEIGAALTMPVVTPFSIIIIAGVIGYFIWQKAKENHIQNVNNNINIIQDFYNKIQTFLSEGADYFCKDGDKNLFVIAYEKNTNNLIREICMFP